MQVHCPVRQTKPLQQSPSAAQVWPWSEHAHTPAVHVSRAQQSAVVAQVNARAAHVRHVPPLHWKPVQQALVALQPAPARPQLGAHLPPEHSKLEQHGAPALQTAPSTPQPVRQTEACPASPARQASWAQHSALVAQVSPAALQRGGAHRPASHPPEQQSAAAAQTCPSARHSRTH